MEASINADSKVVYLNIPQLNNFSLQVWLGLYDLGIIESNT